MRVPQAPSPQPPAPRGISLTEVLISLGVLTVGLLGVAAIFPVGGAFSARGDQRDRADAVAQAALNDAVTRGLLDPENWVAYEDNLMSSTNKFWENAPAYQALGVRETYSRPFAEDYRERLNYAINVQGWNPTQTAARILTMFGGSIVIDPQGVGAITSLNVTPPQAPFNALPALSAFPAAVTELTNSGPQLVVDGTPLVSPALTGRWSPWVRQRAGALGLGWPVQRVSVATNVPRTILAAEPMLAAEADRIVLADDDLAIELPEEGDDPSQSRFTVSGSNALLRQARQEYSWLLTVAPLTFDAHRALATGGNGAYDVSAVVFNRRTLGTNSDLQSLQASERLVRVSIRTPGPGAGGGEALFFRGSASGGSTPAGDGAPDTWWEDPLADESTPWEELRPGQWVYLFGPHTLSADDRPLLFAQWYQVVAIDDSEEANNTVSRLRVQLRGPDWPWTNVANNTVSARFLPAAEEGALWAVIVPDVVAVHTRTLNLQSGAAWQ